MSTKRDTNEWEGKMVDDVDDGENVSKREHGMVKNTPESPARRLTQV